MVAFNAVTASLALSIIGGALAHPGEVHTAEEIKREALESHHAHIAAKRALDKCANSPAALALKERAIARRAATAEALRQKRGITHKQVRNAKRDADALSTWAATTHNFTTEGYTADTPVSELFSNNGTCALVPEVTIGPYFVAGEYIRQDITEDQAGVPLHLEIQFVDVETCEAVPDMLIDIWHCNATGVYSGVSATGQGGLDSTFLRGVQASDTDGVATFDTIFPGHYTGRTTHIHAMSTVGYTVLDNGTYTGGTAKNIGQLFFDQDLISAVEATTPYTTNQQELTVNDDDSIAQSSATAEYDPFVDFALLGDGPADGILGWIILGVNTTADHSSEVSAAAHYYSGGGVDTGNSVGGGGGGGPGGAGGNGSFPGGNGTFSSGGPSNIATASVTATTSGSTSASASVSAVTSISSSGGSSSRHRLRWFAW